MLSTERQAVELRRSEDEADHLSLLKKNVYLPQSIKSLFLCHSFVIITVRFAQQHAQQGDGNHHIDEQAVQDQHDQAYNQGNGSSMG